MLSFNCAEFEAGLRAVTIYWRTVLYAILDIHATVFSNLWILRLLSFPFPF